MKKAQLIQSGPIMAVPSVIDVLDHVGHHVRVFHAVQPNGDLFIGVECAKCDNTVLFGYYTDLATGKELVYEAEKKLLANEGLSIEPPNPDEPDSEPPDLNDDDFGECDAPECYNIYDVGSSIDHCVVEGTCWDHCTDPSHFTPPFDIGPYVWPANTTVEDKINELLELQQKVVEQSILKKKGG